MSQAEFASWLEFYNRYPFDDMHTIHRPAALIAQSMRGGEIGPLIDWLQPRDTEFTDADRKTLAAFGFKS
ncbi:hypothetical protein [Bordetella genomosp. 9]|uniref:Minor tail T domain-containing protein n=1 Tax=Bordetella genomosp. 9 TaxID=1416803 RepID=A0A1W6YYZ5_9BORD|nr:hypothetical protein [Bordetella genomosp. 9]ARP86298.1 hypothetical protein CAL13_08875 [Bordetella genomosp. 9]